MLRICHHHNTPNYRNISSHQIPAMHKNPMQNKPITNLLQTEPHPHPHRHTSKASPYIHKLPAPTLLLLLPSTLFMAAYLSATSSSSNSGSHISASPCAVVAAEMNFAFAWNARDDKCKSRRSRFCAGRSDGGTRPAIGSAPPCRLSVTCPRCGGGEAVPLALVQAEAQRVAQRWQWHVSGFGYHAHSLRTCGWKSSARNSLTAAAEKSGNGSVMPICDGASMWYCSDASVWRPLGSSNTRCADGMNVDDLVRGGGLCTGARSYAIGDGVGAISVIVVFKLGP